MSKPKTARNAAFNSQRYQQRQNVRQEATPKKQGWLSALWSKIVKTVKNMFKKIKSAFQIKERTASGKIANQSWFGKWIAYPAMTAMKWVAVALLWVVRMIAYLLLGAIVVASLLAAIVLAFVGAAFVVALLVVYKFIQGICLIFSSPSLAYADRETSDDIWGSYWKSWHPKYWIAFKVGTVDKLSDFYDAVKEKYSTDQWLRDENLWANATDDECPSWSAA